MFNWLKNLFKKDKLKTITGEEFWYYEVFPKGTKNLLEEIPLSELEEIEKGKVEIISMTEIDKSELMGTMAKNQWERCNKVSQTVYDEFEPNPKDIREAREKHENVSHDIS